MTGDEEEIDVETEADELEAEEAPLGRSHHREPGKRRRRVRNGPRPKVLARRELKAVVFAERLNVGAYDPSIRPKTRGDCVNGCRPCPFAGCKYHLYLSVNPTNGSIVLNFPDLEPWELKESCALDVAERGGITLEEVGVIQNLTRERVRQIEMNGLIKLRSSNRIEVPDK